VAVLHAQPVVDDVFLAKSRTPLFKFSPGEPKTNTESTCGLRTARVILGERGEWIKLVEKANYFLNQLLTRNVQFPTVS
jgi:hypothetical protein